MMHPPNPRSGLEVLRYAPSTLLSNEKPSIAVLAVLLLQLATCNWLQCVITFK